MCLSYQYSWCSVSSQGLYVIGRCETKYIQESSVLSRGCEATGLAQDNAEGQGALPPSLLFMLFFLAAATGARHCALPTAAGGIQKQQGAGAAVCAALQHLGGRSGYDLLTSIFRERPMTFVECKTVILGPCWEGGKNPKNSTPSSGLDAGAALLRASPLCSTEAKGQE